MKTGFFCTIVLLTLQIAFSQSTNSTSNVVPTNDVAPPFQVTAGASNDPTRLSPPPFTTELSRTFETPISPLESKADEMFIGNVRVSGIAIEAAKTGNPVSLINPVGPPTNSSSEDNIVRDPFNGKVNGLSIFTIHF